VIDGVRRDWGWKGRGRRGRDGRREMKDDWLIG